MGIKRLGEARRASLPRAACRTPPASGIPSWSACADGAREAGFDLADLSVVNKSPDGRLLEMDGLFVLPTVKGLTQRQGGTEVSAP